MKANSYKYLSNFHISMIADSKFFNKKNTTKMADKTESKCVEVNILNFQQKN